MTQIIASKLLNVETQPPVEKVYKEWKFASEKKILQSEKQAIASHRALEL
jgi:hypothetical protein